MSRASPFALDQAIADRNAALRLNPNNKLAAQIRAEAYRRRGN